MLETHRQIADDYLQHASDWSRCDDDGLQHLAAHLYELRTLPEYRHKLYNLIDEPWMQARYERGKDTYTGFLSDVELAWRVAVSHDLRDPVLLVRLWTAYQVIQHQGSDYSDELLRALVWLDRADQAVEFSSFRKDSYTRFKGLLAIHAALLARGMPQPDLLAKARDLAMSLSAHQFFGNRDRALEELAEAFAAFGHIAEAHEVTKAIRIDGMRVKALARLATACARLNDRRVEQLFAEARKVAGDMPHHYSRGSAMGELALALAQARRADQGEAVTRSIQSALQRTTTRIGLAAILAQDDADQAEQLFVEARSMSLPHDRDRSFGLRQVATAFAHAGRFAEARELADLNPSEGYRAEALCELAGALARAGDFAESREVVDLIGQGFLARMRAQAVLAGALARAGQFTDAGRLIDSMATGIERDRARSELATELASAGRVLEAHDVSQAIGIGWLRAETLARLATACARAKDTRAATLVIEAIAVQSPQRATPPADILVGLVAALVHVRHAGAARTLVDSIADSRDRAEALAVLAAVMARGKQTEAKGIMAEALLLVASLDADQEREEARMRIVKALAREGQFVEAEQVARSLQDRLKQRGALILVSDAQHDQGVRDGTDDFDVDSTRDAMTRSEAERDRVLGELVKGHSFHIFLSQLPASSIDEYLASLFKWAPLLQQVYPDTSTAVLREAIRVTGWARPDWRKISELLGTAMAG